MKKKNDNITHDEKIKIVVDYMHRKKIEWVRSTAGGQIWFNVFDCSRENLIKFVYREKHLRDVYERYKTIALKEYNEKLPATVSRNPTLNPGNPASTSDAF